MTGSPFVELARQYVLSDDTNRQKEIAETAAKLISQASNTRIAVGQWVASINSWIQPGDDSADDDFIARAKALEFLASTLENLKRNDALLKADQIKLLVTFFGSLFSSDHKAGVTASTKALKHIVTMKAFQPTLGNDIIQSICKLGDDFKLQAPTTRLEIYELVLSLLQDPAVANDLEYQHGPICGFMTEFIEICRNERDPQNLIVWFEILKTFLQNFSPASEVTSEVFKTFSAYFPISLRASATPSGITADDLKGAVRGCFAAHHRLASLSIPYLINKLDQGDAVTVAVKVDILQTLDACVASYEHPKQSVVPFVDQIWSSLKYEVRNGEVPDTIKATLKVIGTLVKRLDVEELRPFIATCWRDLVEDLSNPTYTAQSGRLLIAIAGATPESFAAAAPHAVHHLQKTVRNTLSLPHRNQALTILNSLLVIRSHLTSTVEESSLWTTSNVTLDDELFGDSLFRQVYLYLWQDTTYMGEDAEYAEMAEKVLEGAAALLGQRSTGTGSSQRLCSDDTCDQIFNWLSVVTITYPINNEMPKVSAQSSAVMQDLRKAATAALEDALPHYPSAFRVLLLQYSSSMKEAYQRQHFASLVSEPELVAMMFHHVGCRDAGTTRPGLINLMHLVNTSMDNLLWMLQNNAGPKYVLAFIRSIHLSIRLSLSSATKNGAVRNPSTNLITAEWYEEFSARMEETHAPRLDTNKCGDFEQMEKSLETLHIDEEDVSRQLLGFCLWILGQLYRRFTVLQNNGEERPTYQWKSSLGPDFQHSQKDLIAQEDLCIYHLSLLATDVVRVLQKEEQKKLRLDLQAFSMFHFTAFGSIGQVRPTENDICLSWAGDLRTTPLSMGIFQGLYPQAILPELRTVTISALCKILTKVGSSCSDVVRCALDTTLTILVNKYNIKDDGLDTGELEQQTLLAERYMGLWEREPGIDAPNGVRIFRSVLYYLAGDVARFNPGDEANSLLALVYDHAPEQASMGRQLAQSMEVLVSPKICLQRENHAITKRLSRMWLYNFLIAPRLGRCFPSNGTEDRRSVNRAVAAFAILKHLAYNQYANDVAKIVRIAIRSLSTFKIGVEMESCLIVLREILDNDPGALKEHLTALITGVVGAYEMARKVAKAAEFMEDPRKLKTRGREPVLCRKFALEFFQKLPRAYEAQYLVPHRQQLLRPLSMACGDSVREIRRTALLARQAWEALA
ncbi:Dos2-interacting transcription regulator of RNA-Pol-II-domain-containing protein [Xylariomycetidae sp. FL2044]|nr:Dos2-interacting transcription regulator of RNA-Pol-II-domain-containing protein [Xylariomycetidae sp. FL2044]